MAGAKSGKAGPRGYVQVYTGDGKGKTTAAVGLAVRAAGAGLRVYLGQFLQGRPCS
ncbi:MAG: cob(I)yrinic acid a,c-diamide adenosyltransferase, partial [Lentisphaerae bacterium]|nr:cob(I)yrinic acid a,c-diamide adenosyltransferase [Lentisphaerota bacterium]